MKRSISYFLASTGTLATMLVAGQVFASEPAGGGGDSGGMLVRCSYHTQLLDINADTVELCPAGNSACRGSCSGLSLSDDALNPNLPAGDLIINQVDAAGMPMSGELPLPFQERLAIWVAHRDALNATGAVHILPEGNQPAQPVQPSSTESAIETKNGKAQGQSVVGK